METLGRMGASPMGVADGLDRSGDRAVSKEKRRIYLSGPMSGYPEHNYPLFHRVAAELRAEGHHVYNPAEYQHDEVVFPLRKAFADYARFICLEACTIVLLPGWEASLGVSAELALAKNCRLDVVHWIPAGEEVRQ